MFLLQLRGGRMLSSIFKPESNNSENVGNNWDDVGTSNLTATDQSLNSSLGACGLATGK